MKEIKCIVVQQWVGPIPLAEDFKVGNQIPNFFLFQLQTQFRTAGDDGDKKRRVLNPEGLPRQTLLWTNEWMHWIQLAKDILNCILDFKCLPNWFFFISFLKEVILATFLGLLPTPCVTQSNSIRLFISMMLRSCLHCSLTLEQLQIILKMV